MDCPNCNVKLSAQRFYISGIKGPHRLCRECEQYFKEPPRKRTTFTKADLDAAVAKAVMERTREIVKRLGEYNEAGGLMILLEFMNEEDK